MALARVTLGRAEWDAGRNLALQPTLPNSQRTRGVTWLVIIRLEIRNWPRDARRQIQIGQVVVEGFAAVVAVVGRGRRQGPARGQHHEIGENQDQKSGVQK